MGSPAQPGRESLAGVVERMRYHDPRTRYTVALINVPGRPDLAVAVGRSDGLEEGLEVELVGRWVDHPKHGMQFSFEQLRDQAPSTPGGIARRLELYPGIGASTAHVIVKKFGADTLRILDEQPRRLLEVSGIGSKTLERIMAYHETRVGPLADLENVLLELDMSTRFAAMLQRRYGAEAESMLRHQPYRLAREVRGIGFATADRIARAQGVARDDPDRIDAGLVHTLTQATSDGHCALPQRRLVSDAARVLGVDAELVEPGVERLVQDGDLVGDEMTDGDFMMFLTPLRDAEERVAERFVELALAGREPWTVGELPESLSEGQRRAVESIAKTGVVLLTGGPGTGKSTVVRNVIEVAEEHDCELFLAAPTGRAAKRLEQTTGREAKTVHRLLEVAAESGEFARNANNPLPPGLVVIDESSMLDISLADALCAALDQRHRLLLVGDADQLPSVGPGNVLRDLLAGAGEDNSPIPVVRLDRIFRQSEGSTIVVNAHRILAGQSLVPDEGAERGEFYFTRVGDPDKAREWLVRMVCERIPEVYGLDPVTDVQVLCPMHRGRVGTDVLNRELQARHTAQAPALEYGGGLGPRLYRVGDRVMQTKNDYERNVFNGDIGTVTSVDPEKTALVVDVDGVSVRYEGRELNFLQLAYAITIHKSQGSEFPAVIVPLLNEHHVMLRRNLLYTAVTRARRLCVVIGDSRAVERAVRRADDASRFTGLGPRVVGAYYEKLGLSMVEYEPDDSAGSEEHGP